MYVSLSPLYLSLDHSPTFIFPFDVIPHPSKDGLFILKSKSSPVIEAAGDENINIEDEDSELDFNLDDMSEDVTEIDANFFKL